MTAPRARHSRCLLVALLLAATLAVTGCDDTIDTPDSLRGSYTLWGALDPTSTVQSVRVVPVTDTIGVGTAAPLPVDVRSVDLSTGAETAWRDSVVTFPDGSIGHIYRAAFRPAYGSRHRIVVRRDEGGEVSALVAVPPYVEPLVQATRTAGGTLQYPILWPGAPQINRVRVIYSLIDAGGGAVTVTRTVFAASGPVEFGWQTLLDLGQDDEAIQAQAGGRPGDITLVSFRIAGEVASEDWRPPSGGFDFDLFSDPSVFGNVRGGFGFVGAAYDVSVEYVPTTCELTRTSFRNNVQTGACP